MIALTALVALTKGMMMKTIGGLVAVSAALALAACAEEAAVDDGMEEETMAEDTADTMEEATDGEAMESETAAAEEDLDETGSPIGPGDAQE